MNRTDIENQRVIIFKAIYGVTSQIEILETFREELLEFKKIRNDDDYKNSESSRIFSKYILAITFLYRRARDPNIKKNDYIKNVNSKDGGEK